VQALKKTPLNKVHHELRARMMDFAGWELPAWYTSILEEHKAVRTGAGIFDVSDMGRVWVTGRQAGDFLDRVLARPAHQLEAGSSHLSLMCLEDGGILDDLWLFRMSTDRYLIIWNAANVEQKLDWLSDWSGSNLGVDIEDVSADTAMVAVQGPLVLGLGLLDSVSNLPRFGHAASKVAGLNVLVARTGYTGEDGFEIMGQAADATRLWDLFIEQGVRPCGLGARDSLRLEAGMLLCGQDMDAGTNPFEAGLGWLVDLDRGDFVGRQALVEIKSKGVKRKLVGFQVDGREIARSGYPIVVSGKEVGRVTSGGHAPSLGVNIGLGYVPTALSAIGTRIEIVIRNKPVPAQVVDKRFYRKGG
jgi:aminomethyltransferase